MNQYTLGKQIGKGAFAKVYLIKDQNGNEYSCKIMDKPSTQERMNQLQMEINILLYNQHPNLLTLITTYKKEDQVYIVCEYCNQGSLENYLESNSTMGFSEKIQIIKCIVAGYINLYNRNIIHGDIKLSNLLVHKDKNGVMVKYADFGVSAWVDNEKNHKFEDLYIKGYCGTLDFMAPELLSKKEITPFDYKIDIYSIGVCICKLLFNDKIKADKIGNYSLKVQSDVNENAVDLMIKCLQLNKEKRWKPFEMLAFVEVIEPGKYFPIGSTIKANLESFDYKVE